MKRIGFEEAIAQILQKDVRYDAEAYRFVREALDVTLKLFEKPSTGPARHVSGQELLEGFRRHALAEFGPMALRVLSHWGVRRSEDVGELVFNLVEIGALGKTDRDRREDFSGGYDFHEAFRAPFQARPAQARKPAAAPKGRAARSAGSQ